MGTETVIGRKGWAGIEKDYGYIEGWRDISDGWPGISDGHPGFIQKDYGI